MPKSVRLLGIKVHLMTRHELCNHILAFIKARQGGVIANLNIHCAYHYERSLPMRETLDHAQLVFLDSGPLAIWGKLLGLRVGLHERQTAVDFLPVLLGKCEAWQVRVFFLGGLPSLQRPIRQWIADRYPNLVFASHHGYISGQEEDVIGTVVEFEPDLLLVGMGMPLQEEWLQHHGQRLPQATKLCMGATFDYFTGKIPTPPRWLGRIGCEGLYRLCCEPRRLWRRYLLYPILLAPRFVADLLLALTRQGQWQPVARIPD